MMEADNTLSNELRLVKLFPQTFMGSLREGLFNIYPKIK
jgi:hypothetical protein